MIIDFYIIFIILFFIYMFREKKKLLFSSDINEEFGNYNKDYFIEKLPYYKHIIKEQEFYYPLLLTNYKYSLEYKFGFEFSKLFNIKFKQTNGLKENLDRINSDYWSEDTLIGLTTENILLKSLENKSVNRDRVRFVCTLYNLDFLLLSRFDNSSNKKLSINSWKDIKKYLENEENEKYNMGVLNEGTSSEFEYENLLKDAGIILNADKLNIINTKNIQDSFNMIENNELDSLFLVSCNKNPYIINFFKKRIASIIGTEGIKNSLIKKKYTKYLKTYIQSRQYTKSIFKKQNSIFNNKLNIINENKKIETISSRLIVVAKKELSEDYIIKFLRHLYANNEKLRTNLNNYLYVPSRNNIMKLFEPVEMSYVDKSILYHKGARKFYKEIDLIQE